jgi:hypothetical protein
MLLSLLEKKQKGEKKVIRRKNIVNENKRSSLVERLKEQKTGLMAPSSDLPSPPPLSGQL